MIETERLILRNWNDEDRIAFAEMNACDKVCEFFPNTLSKEESDDLAAWIMHHLEVHHWGLWAVEEKATGNFLGFTGISHYEGETHFAPAVEIGWRLTKNCWGKGYATEGAKAVLDFAFNKIRLPEIVAFTAKDNVRSRRVMEKIGMVYNPEDDFNHPKVPESSPLKQHVLYRVERQCIQKVMS